MKELFVPALGMAMEECTLAAWLKQPGDPVVEGESVAEIETDKATIDLESPVTGRLGRHLVDEGARVRVGATVVRVLEGDETDPEPDSTAQATGTELGAESGEDPASDADADAQTTTSAPEDEDEELEFRVPHKLSPRERRLGAEREVAAESGDDFDRDIQRHREAIAQGVSESWRTMPHFGVTREIRAEALLSTVKQERGRLPDLTVTDLLIRALALAFEAHDRRGDGGIGLAVATDRGVSIPVIADVAQRRLSRLVDSRKQAVKRARTARMAATDLQSPPCTLSNLGGYEVDYFTGIIPVGQTALLTVGRAKQRPIVADGYLAVTTTLFATLNVDHRIYDGVHAAAILDTFAEIVADPARLAGITTTEETR